MSSVDGISLILIALRIDIPEVFFPPKRALPSSGTIAIYRICGAADARLRESIVRYDFTARRGREYRSSVGSLRLLRRATAFARSRIVIRIGRRISPKRIPIRKTSYTYREQERWSCSSSQTPKSAYAYASKSGFGLAKEYTMYQFTAGSWRIFATFSLVFSRCGSFNSVIDRTIQPGIVYAGFGKLRFRKENLGTLRNTYFER